MIAFPAGEFRTIEGKVQKIQKFPKVPDRIGIFDIVFGTEYLSRLGLTSKVKIDIFS